MQMHFRGLALVLALSGTTLGCSDKNDELYKPAAAYSGRKASVPSVPSLPSAPIKSGESYTIAGLIHQLNSRIHDREVNSKDLSVVGYIIDTNILTAPKCAVHKTGKKDPDDCKDVPIPSFWIADKKETDAKDPKAQKIRVLGWASNFANVFEAMQKYKALKEPPKELYKDEFTAVEVPFPLPAVGAKIKLTAKYGYSFHGGSSLVSDPRSGVLTFQKIEVLEPAPEPAAFAKN